MFLDGYDLHLPFGVNYYGPVLFVMKLDLLLDEHFEKLRVTRSNPSNWSLEPRFHENINEIDEKYLVGGKFNKTVDANIMFLLDAPGTNVSLEKYCERIILDDPGVIASGKGPVYDLVKKTLEVQLAEFGLSKILIERRHGNETKNFDCHLYYRRMATFDMTKFNHNFSKKCKPLRS